MGGRLGKRSRTNGSSMVMANMPGGKEDSNSTPTSRAIKSCQGIVTVKASTKEIKRGQGTREKVLYLKKIWRMPEANKVISQYEIDCWTGVFTVAPELKLRPNYQGHTGG